MAWSLSPALSQPLLRYYFGPDHRLKIRLWDWVHRILGRPQFTVRYERMAWLSLDLGDFIQFEIAKTGAYEPEVWDRLSEHAEDGEIVWDIGANIGSFTFRAAVDPKVSQVHAFEPNPVVVKQLRKNAHLNSKLRVQVHSVALAADTAEREFYCGLEANRGVGGFFAHWPSNKTWVPCFRGDDWISLRYSPAPTLIKIDVEGAELEVLQGLEKTLLYSPPKAIIFEAHWGAKGELLSQPVVDYLLSMNYTVEIPPPGREGHPVNLVATPAFQDFDAP